MPSTTARGHATHKEPPPGKLRAAVVAQLALVLVPYASVGGVVFTNTMGE
jgi:hypothetical protein